MICLDTYKKLIVKKVDMPHMSTCVIIGSLCNWLKGDIGRKYYVPKTEIYNKYRFIPYNKESRLLLELLYL